MRHIKQLPCSALRQVMFCCSKVFESSHFSNFCHILRGLLVRPKTARGHAVMCQGFVCNNDLTTEKCFPSQRSSEKLVKTFHSDFAGNCNSLNLMAPTLFAASNSLRRACFSTLFWLTSGCSMSLGLIGASLFSRRQLSALDLIVQSCISLV